MKRFPILKVAYFIDALNVGGTESQLVMLINSMDRARILSHLFCLRPAQNPMSEIAHCPNFQLNVATFKSLSTWVQIARTAIWLRREQIDVVQTYFPDASLFGLVAGRIAQRPVTVMCHRDMGHWLSTASKRRIRFLNRLADQILVNAQCIKSEILRNGHIPEERVTVIPNMVDMRRFVNENGDRLETRRVLGLSAEHVVGIVANLNRPVKRVDTFIRAACDVALAQPSTDFVIVGDGHLKPDLTRLADQLGILDKVRFVGSRSDVPRILSAFDVAVNSSDSEGFCNALLEYMAAGVPTIATDVGGNRELIGEDSCGKLVPPNDPQAMASAILHYLTHPDSRTVAGENARRRIEKRYHLSAVSRDMMDYYDRICS